MTFLKCSINGVRYGNNTFMHSIYVTSAICQGLGTWDDFIFFILLKLYDQLFRYLGDSSSSISHQKVSLNAFCKYTSIEFVSNSVQLIFGHGIDMPMQILLSTIKHFCRNFKRVIKYAFKCITTVCRYWILNRSPWQQSL